MGPRYVGEKLNRHLRARLVVVEHELDRPAGDAAILVDEALEPSMPCFSPPPTKAARPVSGRMELMTKSSAAAGSTPAASARIKPAITFMSLSSLSIFVVGQSCSSMRSMSSSLKPK